MAKSRKQAGDLDLQGGDITTLGTGTSAIASLVALLAALPKGAGAARPVVTAAIHDAIVAADFTTTPGVLSGTAPAGSLLDMKFSEGGWKYDFFERGASLTPTWHRVPLA